MCIRNFQEINRWVFQYCLASRRNPYHGVKGGTSHLQFFLQAVFTYAVHHAEKDRSRHVTSHTALEQQHTYTAHRVHTMQQVVMKEVCSACMIQ